MPKIIASSAEQPDECAKCGALCCKTMIIGVNGATQEDLQFWATTGRMIGSACVLNMKCKMLAGNKCSIYDLRPEKCKNFIVNGAACMAIIKAVNNESEDDIHSWTNEGN